MTNASSDTYMRTEQIYSGSRYIEQKGMSKIAGSFSDNHNGFYLEGSLFCR